MLTKEGRISFLANKAQALRRARGIPMPLAIHIACDGDTNLTSEVASHLNTRRMKKTKSLKKKASLPPTETQRDRWSRQDARRLGEREE
jgi:hypothetical protein